RFLTLENAAAIDADLPVPIDQTATVAHEAASCSELPKRVDRWQRVMCRKLGKLLGLGVEDCVDADHQARDPQLGQRRTNRIQFAFAAGMQNMNLQPENTGRRREFSRQDLSTGVVRVNEKRDTPRCWR